jgi:hypothetical protein
VRGHVNRSLAKFLAQCEIFGIIGAIFFQQTEWYGSLIKSLALKVNNLGVVHSAGRAKNISPTVDKKVFEVQIFLI